MLAIPLSVLLAWSTAECNAAVGVVYLCGGDVSGNTTVVGKPCLAKSACKSLDSLVIAAET